ncbi:MAG: hypothetical protein Q8O66_02380, partial [bacterium]|nr:hypothetical protein [bacterium]
MPNYYYTAKTFDGRTKTGILPAKDVSQLAQTLKGERMLLIKAISEDEKKKNRFNFLITFSSVSTVEKIMLTRNLHIMIATGLSLVRSFDILSIQSKNP